MYTKYREQESIVEDRPMNARRSFRLIPPVAYPIRTTDLLSGVAAAGKPQEAYDQFSQSLLKHTGAQSLSMVSSGRSALSLILMNLPNYHPGAKVLIPAYSCSTVMQSVLNAGLTPVFCDVSLDTLDYDRPSIAKLITDDLLAVVGAHLYGLVNNFSELARLTAQKNITFIEDAAQSFGATFDSKMAGTQAEIGFYSLGRGKCLPAGGGGVIVSRGELGLHLQEGISEQIKNGKLGLSHLVHLAGYQAAVNPIGWRLIDRSSLNPAEAGSDFDHLPEIQHRKLSAVRAGIGSSLLKQSSDVFDIWRSNAARLSRMLRNHPFLRVPEVPEGAGPVYLRFPIILDSSSRTERLWRKLNQAGIGTSRSYRFTLPGMYGVSRSVLEVEYPGAVHLSESLLALPTNHYLDDRSFQIIETIFQAESSKIRREINAR